METVEVVIRIPKNRYETLVELNERIKNKESIYKLGMYENAIANGIPLPEGHGRLKDADALIDTLGCSDRDIYCKSVIEEDAPTIIEKDKGGEWMKIGECTRKNTCYDCDNKECHLHGKKESDCPKYYCDREGNGFHDCDNCPFIDWFINDERQRYKSESEVNK